MFEKYFLYCHWGHDNAVGASKLESRQIRLLYSTLSVFEINGAQFSGLCARRVHAVLAAFLLDLTLRLDNSR